MHDNGEKGMQNWETLESPVFKVESIYLQYT